jgi:hypothetical protein
VEYKELKELMDLVDREAEAKKKELVYNYCHANNTVKIGDTVKDHIGSVRVDKINFAFNHGKPCCVYHGIELTKKLEENKRKTRRGVYQCNLVT